MYVILLDVIKYMEKRAIYVLIYAGTLANVLSSVLGYFAVKSSLDPMNSRGIVEPIRVKNVFNVQNVQRNLCDRIT